jgi:exonuclease V gamma subunit
MPRAKPKEVGEPGGEDSTPPKKVRQPSTRKSATRTAAAKGATQGVRPVAPVLAARPEESLQSAVRKFLLGESSPIFTAGEKIHALLESLYQKAVAGDVRAVTTLLEYYEPKPKIAEDEGPTAAEELARLLAPQDLEALHKTWEALMRKVQD